MPPRAVIDHDRIDAVVFDMDGVVTETASVHAAAWKRLFDEVLAERGQPPFDADAEYRRYVDGKPRYDGVRDFLAELRENGARAFPTTVELVRRLDEAGIGTAIISASESISDVLAAAGV